MGSQWTLTIAFNDFFGYTEGDGFEFTADMSRFTIAEYLS
jgi:hypothetical protein